MSATSETGGPAEGQSEAKGSSPDRVRDRKALKTLTSDPVEELAPLGDFPASERVYREDPGHPDIRVPVRPTPVKMENKR